MERHIPVLLNEVLNFAPPHSKVILDCTLGDGSHSEALLKKFSSAKLVGIDADPESILRSKNFLYEYKDRLMLFRERFDNCAEVLKKSGNDAPDYIIFDLGWSSPQFKERGRGFSFANPTEPLDMRFNPSSGATAAELLNTLSAEELGKILRKYGEEKKWKELASSIVEKRESKPFETVNDLLQVVASVKPRTYKDKINPATLVFQALRIAVNNELDVLNSALHSAMDIVKTDGRIVVISFHSLEDRIVKEIFNSSDGFKIITKKAVVPRMEEIKNNPRSRSAKIRVIEKL